MVLILGVGSEVYGSDSLPALKVTELSVTYGSGHEGA